MRAVLKKTFYIFASSLFLFFLSIPPSFAQSDTAPQRTPPNNVRNIVKERELRQLQLKEKIRDQAAEKKATSKGRLVEARKERIRAYFVQMVIRLEATVKRLEILIQRIEARLLIINDENPGLNTDPIEKEIVKAKELLEDTTVDIKALENNLEEFLNSEDPQSSFLIIKDEAVKIRKQLAETHRILVKVIGDIKGLRVGQLEAKPTGTGPANTR